MISIPSFEHAISERLSPAVAARLKVGLSEIEPDSGGLTFHDAGELLVLAVLGGDPGKVRGNLEGAELTTTEIVAGDGTSILLPPSEALAHPLLAIWGHASVEGLIGEAIRAGTELTQLAPGAPVFESFELVTVDGAFVLALGRLHFSFNAATAIFHYGDPQALHSPLAVHTKITGNALVEIGQVVRLSAALCAAPATSVLAPAETKH